MIPVPKSKRKIEEYKRANERIKEAIEMIYVAESNITKQLKILSQV
jgi:hypothetical protein